MLTQLSCSPDAEVGLEFGVDIIVSSYCIGIPTVVEASTSSPFTGLLEMIVGVLTTCHTQYTSDRRICIFLFNSTTLQVFATYLIGALYVHPL